MHAPVWESQYKGTFPSISVSITALCETRDNNHKLKCDQGVFVVFFSGDHVANRGCGRQCIVKGKYDIEVAS